MQIYVDFRGGVVSPAYAKIPTETMSFLSAASNMMSTSSETLYRRLGAKFVAKGKYVFPVTDWKNEGNVFIWDTTLKHYKPDGGQVTTVGAASFLANSIALSIPTIAIEGTAENATNIPATILFTPGSQPYAVFNRGGSWVIEVYTPWTATDESSVWLKDLPADAEGRISGFINLKDIFTYTDQKNGSVRKPSAELNNVVTISSIESRIHLVLRFNANGWYISTQIPPASENAQPLYEDFTTTLTQNVAYGTGTEDKVTIPQYNISVAPYFYQTDKSGSLAWMAKSIGYFYASDRGVFYNKNPLNATTIAQAEQQLTTVGGYPNLVTVVNKAIYYVSTNRKAVYLIKEIDAQDSFEAVDACPQMRHLLKSGVKKILSMTYPSDAIFLLMDDKSVLFMRVTENGLSGFPLDFGVDVNDITLVEGENTSYLFMATVIDNQECILQCDIPDFEALQEYDVKDFLDIKEDIEIYEESLPGNYQGIWRSSLVYNAEDYVKYNDIYYTCGVGSSTQGEAPDTSPEWFKTTAKILYIADGDETRVDRYEYLLSQGKDVYIAINDILHAVVSFSEGFAVLSSEVTVESGHVTIGIVSDAYIETSPISQRAGQKYKIDGVIASFINTGAFYVKTENTIEERTLNDDVDELLTGEIETFTPTEYKYGSTIRVGNNVANPINITRLVIKE